MAQNLASSDLVTHTDPNANPNTANPDDVTNKKKPTSFPKFVSEELPNADSKLLNNAIHPIFQKQNWEQPAQSSWPLLEPALRLASRLIGEDEMLAFWYHLIWGTQKMQDESEAFGQTLEKFSVEGPPLTTTQKQQTKRWLQGFRGKPQSPFLNFQAEEKWARTGQRITDGTITVELYSGLLELLRGQKTLSKTQMLRVNFWIAIILLHELAHAVPQSLSSSEHEPCYGDQVQAELGYAWTCWAFGGMIEPFRLAAWEDQECIGGFWITTPPSPWSQIPRPSEYWPASRPRPPVLGDLPKRGTSWNLATLYVQRVQTEEFWEEEIRAHGVRALHIAPTEGCDDSQISLNPNWKARLHSRRGPNDKKKIEGLHFKNSVTSKKENSRKSE